MTNTLMTVLAGSDMLEIDGLHAFDFTLDAAQLLIIAMDGRAEKRWCFSLDQVQAATFDETLQSWIITDDSGDEHRLVCMSAITGNNNDEDETDEHA